jgi:hypothetical protein
MKRARYTIPTLGLGLTMLGCQDPVVGDFNVTFFDGLGIPLEYSETDPATNVTCSTSVAAAMTVDKDLQAKVDVSYAYLCDDGSIDYTETSNYTGAFEVIEKGFDYKITLVSGDTSLALDCAMDEAGVLFCNDVTGSAFVFEPK